MAIYKDIQWVIQLWCTHKRLNTSTNNALRQTWSKLTPQLFQKYYDPRISSY